MKVSVIIPTYRNPDYLDLCLSSILDHQVYENEVMVIVDGFLQETRPVLEKYVDHPSIKILELEDNQGMQAAINFGAMSSEAEYLFIINDDNVFPEKWDERLIPFLQKDFVLTVNQIEPTGPGMFNFPVVDCGQTFETFDMTAYLDAERDLSLTPNKLELETGRIFPFVIHKQWFMASGGFDTFYNSPNICDWDFFLKLQLMPGNHLQFHRLKSLSLYHFGSVATKKNDESESFKMREQFAMNQFYFKWGFSPTNQPTTNSKLPISNRFRGFSI